jgi:hypothetical protein
LMKIFKKQTPFSTDYWLDCPGIESLLGRVFLPRRHWRQGAPSPLQRVPDVSREKRPKSGAHHPPSSGTEVTKGSELYQRHPSCLHRHVMGWSLPLLFIS